MNTRSQSFIYLFIYFVCCIRIIGQSVFSHSEKLHPEILCNAAPIKAQDLLSKYIQFQSISGEEKMAGEFLLSVCKSSGFYIRQFGDQNGNFNFIASLYPLDLKKPNILFLNHIDVVPAEEDQNWKYPPFGGIIDDGKIHGRGAYDNKGIAVMQLAAISAFVKLSRVSDLPFNVSLLSVSCEETMCEGGARSVVEHHFEELNAYALIGEGTPGLRGILDVKSSIPIFGIGIACKSILWLQLELEMFTSGHSSIPPINYANKQMILSLFHVIDKNQPFYYTTENKQFLKSLGQQMGGFRGFILDYPNTFKPFIRMHITKHPEIMSMFQNTIALTGINSSCSVQNMIPSSISCLLDCRLLPDTDEHLFLSGLIKDLKQKEIAAKIIFKMPHSPVSSVEHPVYNIIRESIKEFYPNATVVPVVLPTGNDSGWFRAKGLACFDVLPFITDFQNLMTIHNANEYLSKKALEDGINIYMRFIQKMVNYD